MARRQPPSHLPGSLLGFRDRAVGLIAARGLADHRRHRGKRADVWLVLLACLRGTGLSQAQVPWQASLAAFAFVRLLTILPLTVGAENLVHVMRAGDIR